MGRPSDLQLNTFKEWMQRPTMGNVYLAGDDKDVWFKTAREDLLTVWRPDSAFSVTSTLSSKIIYIYHSLIGARVHVGLVALASFCYYSVLITSQAADGRDYLRNSVVYQDDKAFKLLKAVATLMASMLPIVGIIVLYQIKEMPLRLGVIAIFTATFSLCLNLITTATVKDIFQATAT